MDQRNLEDQVYLDDINELEEWSLDHWKVMYDFWQRAKFQGASPDLLNKMSEITNHFSAAFNGLKEIRNCFPPMGGKREG